MRARPAPSLESSGVLDKVITRSLIRRLAGERYYERGVAYFEEDRVSSLQQVGDSVRAIVMGSEEYVVQLTTGKAKTLEYRCACPLGSDGEFCKHCVAAGLAWLERTAPAAVKKRAAAPPITDEEVSRALHQEDKETLIAWLLDWAAEDESLHKKLVLAASRHLGSEVLLAETRKSLESAIRVRRFMEYRNMPAYAAGVQEALDGVRALIESGHASAMIDLCESGLRWVAAAIEKVDDSDGYMSELIGQLQELHLSACLAAPPDPVKLGEKLFLLQWQAGYSEWHNSAETYASVLGARGLAAFRKKAEVEWAKVPVQIETQSGRALPHLYTLTSMMESLARQSGDLEELVAVLARDLRSANQYLRIARLYREAAKHDQALEWAERGVAACPGFQAAALRVFVAEEYQRRGRHADALRMIWVEFRNSPGLPSYRELERFAVAAEEWDEWRAQAWALIRRVFAEALEKSQLQAARGGPLWMQQKPDCSLPVELLLHEGKPEEAWQEARSGGCRSDLWQRLATLREKDSPEDAAAVYFQLGDQAIAGARSGKYKPGVQLLEKAAALWHRAGKSAEFDQQLAVLCRKYKLKRTLLELIEKRRKFLYPG